ncbi:hypothetical protein AB0C52_23200 [Streptomyces sp. NPDC048717]|uniref:hypothetical protein n=1 Tax=Streptomyces sp. NPDC048717 TaxID=3154928 RepID=UPI0034203556
MTIGLLSTIAAALYTGTVSLLALTATFARRRTLRREARSTLAVLMSGRPVESQQTAPSAGGPNS